MADINLLPVEDKSVENLTDLQKKATFASFGVLLLTAIATVAILVMFTKYAGERNKLNEQIGFSSRKIESLKNVEELLVVVGKKATSAQTAISLRFDYTKFFNSFSALVPQGVFFSDVKINGSKLSISGKARTSADVAGFVSSLVSDSGSALVSGANIDSLSSDDKGVYTFSMNAELVQSGQRGVAK